MSFKDVKALRLAGKLDEAMSMAMNDLEANPSDIWNKRSIAWVYYAYLKNYAQSGDLDNYNKTLNDLVLVGILDVETESMLRVNVVRTAKTIMKNLVSRDQFGIVVSDFANHLVKIFSKVDMPKPSEEYSLYLDVFLQTWEKWSGFSDFVEQWNLDNFMDADKHKREYEVNGKLKKIMSLAECTIIAYSKVLLREKNVEKIRAFLPYIDEMTENPEMLYPGFFYAKLLLAVNADDNDVLKEVLPFVRRKIDQFWTWQFLSEVFRDDEEKYLACLLRASHCSTKEEFLPKVRLALADFYRQRDDKKRMKFHIDRYVRCFLEKGWHVRDDIQETIREEWFKQVEIDESDPIEWLKITDEIAGVKTRVGAQKKITIEGVVVSNSQGSAKFVKGIKIHAIFQNRFQTELLLVTRSE